MSRARWTCALFLLPTILLLTAPLAQAADEVGIYFDPAYTQNQITLDGFPASVTGYLVLKNVSSGYPIKGWEMCVALDGPALFTGWELAGEGVINVLTPPCFTVGIGLDPLPSDGDVLLATFQLLVTEPLPVTFNVGHTQHPSIPDQMAYLTGPDFDLILPMYPVTGHPAVASINENSPWAEVSTSSLLFGERIIGSSTTMTLNVANVGGGFLHLDVAIADGLNEFSLPAVSGELWVEAGHSVTIPVNFVPTAVGEFTGTLDLGPDAPAVLLNGYGREPIVSWTVTGIFDSGELPVGTTASGAVNVRNTGETILLVLPVLGAGCEEFALSAPVTQPVALTPGHTLTIPYVFQPTQPGVFSCTLDLGETVPAVALTGSARAAVVGFTVSPDTLLFGEVVVGYTPSRDIQVRNPGEVPILLDIGLDDPAGCFSLTGVQGPHVLPVGGLVTVGVAFAPETAGAFEALVTFGDLVPPVPAFGVGLPANPACEVQPQQLDFGPVNLGSAAQASFFITNTGNVPLQVTPGESCPHFFIQPYPQVIAPGTTGQLTVVFAPLTAGDFTCAISLGDSGCPPVQCTGTGVPIPPPVGLDLVGIFFDSYYYEFSTYAEMAQLVTGYLVLKAPSATAGVHGWECRHQIEGPALLIATHLSGLALNVGTVPDYIVGLGEPLPPSPDVLLATFTYFMMENWAEVYLTLDPVLTPSIPGYMAYLDGADTDIILPMGPYTGYREVAFINDDSPLAADRPREPVLTAQGGQVQLTWTAPASGYAGYHVYRRDEAGRETRLTTEPGDLGGGTVVFTDQPLGYTTGDVLFYSYSLLTDGGQETARSPEVEHEVQGVTALATRLLPNVPNPFNPQTRIRFELARAGQVRVSIFDVSGRLVKTLEEAALGTGAHERVWLGRDNAGRQAPSGAYYVRLETPDGVDHRKILLLK